MAISSDVSISSPNCWAGVLGWCGGRQPSLLLLCGKAAVGAAEDSVSQAAVLGFFLRDMFKDLPVSDSHFSYGQDLIHILWSIAALHPFSYFYSFSVAFGSLMTEKSASSKAKSVNWDLGGQYRTVEVIGKGSYGQVVKAIDQ